VTQLPKPHAQSLCSAGRSHCRRNPSTTAREQPPLAAARESPCAATKTQGGQTKKSKYFLKDGYDEKMYIYLKSKYFLKNGYNEKLYVFYQVVFF